MVRGDVEQHRRLGRELVRVLELERGDLADDDRPRVERAGPVGRRAREAAERKADVAGDHDGKPGRAVDRAEQLDRGRLPVGPGDGDELLGQQPPGELQLADHDRAARPRGGNDRRLARHPGALDHAAHTLERRAAVRDDLDAQRGELGAAARVAVGAEHALAAREERGRRRGARAGEPDDQVRTARERWTAHLIECE